MVGGCRLSAQISMCDRSPRWASVSRPVWPMKLKATEVCCHVHCHHRCMCMCVCEHACCCFLICQVPLTLPRLVHHLYLWANIWSPWIVPGLLFLGVGQLSHTHNKQTTTITARVRCHVQFAEIRGAVVKLLCCEQQTSISVPVGLIRLYW